MPVRSRLNLNVTVQDLEVAAEEKYYEGLELIAQGYPGGGIYLLGYTVEMLLKYSYFRFAGYPLTDPVKATLEPIRQRSRGLLGLTQVAWEGGHGLPFWLETLRHERVHAGRPLPGAIDAGLQACGYRMAGNWAVEMRYHQDEATPREGQEAAEDAGWFCIHALDLWR